MIDFQVSFAWKLLNETQSKKQQQRFSTSDF